MDTEPETTDAPATETAAEPGVLAGTGSELAPGVGGTGDHPAPAVMVDPATGFMRQHGESLINTAGNQAPIGDLSDTTSADNALDPEARERLDAVTEPDQAETNRPDLGTPDQEDA